MGVVGLKKKIVPNVILHFKVPATVTDKWQKL